MCNTDGGITTLRHENMPLPLGEKAKTIFAQVGLVLGQVRN